MDAFFRAIRPSRYWLSAFDIRGNGVWIWCAGVVQHAYRKVPREPVILVEVLQLPGDVRILAQSGIALPTALNQRIGIRQLGALPGGDNRFQCAHDAVEEGQVFGADLQGRKLAIAQLPQAVQTQLERAGGEAKIDHKTEQGEGGWAQDLPAQRQLT